MNVVLFHTGTSLPDHIKYCIRQLLHTNPKFKIYFLTNLNFKSDEYVNIVNINNFTVPNIDHYFQHCQEKQLWQTSLRRLFYIEEFLKESELQDVVHFDNDVLVFSDLSKHITKFKKFNFLITPHFETEYVFGFSYIKNYKVLTEINKELLKLVALPHHELQSLAGQEFPHEMRLLNYINTANNGKYISNLPVVVDGPGSDNFDVFQTIFDPSTYGKHVGGSHNMGTHNPDYVATPDWHGTELHHYAGRQISEGKIKVTFDGKYPMLNYNNKEQYPITNLHIHDKNLKDFVLC
tara:strand:- start:2895 stop:3773 length:879 start_codon:yes stop_codon:yes gene_type:complete